MKIDHRWFGDKLRLALSKREAMFTSPYYRLIHAESDGIPGIIIDRYGDAISIIVHCAGMGLGNLLRPLVKAVEEVLQPEKIIFRHDSAADRSSKAGAGKCEVYKGVVSEPVEMLENNVSHYVDLKHGQGTGWYFDHRQNRQKLSALAPSRRVLDLYSGTGGFGLQCFGAGAKSVTMVDTVIRIFNWRNSGFGKSISTSFTSKNWIKSILLQILRATR